MKKIGIYDATLARENGAFSFKERIEIARQLEKLCVDTIELPEIKNARTDILFVRTVSAFVKNSVISVAAGNTMESIENAAAALSNTANPCIRIELPLSTALMEYSARKKAPAMLSWIETTIKKAKELCKRVEFCAVDATRAEDAFLKEALKAAVDAGADSLCICDSAGTKMPDDFADFVSEIANSFSVPVGVSCENKCSFAVAQAILSVRKGVDFVKTDISSNGVDLEAFSDMVKNCGNDYGFTADIKQTELHRIVKQIARISDNAKTDTVTAGISAEYEEFRLDKNDTEEAVFAAAVKLGYDLSEEDCAKVYEEFRRVAEKKNVGAKELDAIIATVALQVPETYKLENYVITSGNIISSSAQITLSKNGEDIKGVQIGDGPVNAAFLAIESIIGAHYELDDFQIQSVTEGRQALGSAIVKLRSNGKLYSGNGISTDIIGASIKAYINAVNKIVYEEA